METNSPKYPRTPHLPWSSGTRDDRVVASVDSLLGTNLVITEKLDGSNLSLEHSAVYARSHGGAPPHPSFHVAKSTHAAVKSFILPHLQYFAEYCYAVHSIEYTQLPASMFVFGVRSHPAGRASVWLSWEQTWSMATLLNLTAFGSVTSNMLAPAPVLWKGQVKNAKELQDLTEKLGAAPSLFGGTREGVVVRLAREFPDDQFESSVAKWVRKGHVQTDQHWKNQEIRKQNIKP